MKKSDGSRKVAGRSRKKVSVARPKILRKAMVCFITIWRLRIARGSSVEKMKYPIKKSPKSGKRRKAVYLERSAKPVNMPVAKRKRGLSWKRKPR